MIRDEWRTWLEDGRVLLVASRNLDGTPECLRGIGLRIESPAQLRLLFNGETAAQLVENVKRGSWVAVTASDPLTYQSLQFKGPAALTAVTAEDIAHVGRWRERFIAQVAPMLGASQPYRKLRTQAEVCVRLEVAEVYDQTPGRGAGKKVGP
jgi:hypothetical protein